ncbi:response regulator transcription factor [Flammeovirga kamogawensis]|uniref:Response regulator transcription factor n=1 Tax=Flammeovirga kamogawensis TaxID=373891 RepID=A0ABX8GTL7_9BACT|nr:response regulator transcription factor [Flammeovirga kamogawensis]MBB6460013.1 DNA-binding NarL/FixJ family response regulator [Flammeovirga kamogawensis]QWG06939.1 response regulator transcription factor [Flammeovirga kamogawensis]
MYSINILIVDDHILFSMGIEQLIKKHFTAEVQSISNPEEALKLPLGIYDIILIDMDMPQMKGFEFIERAQKKLVGRKTKFLIVTMHDKPSIIKKTIEQKINGYILKDDNAKEFVKAIDSLKNNGTYFSERIKHILESSTKDNEVFLSPREEDILKLVAKGRSNADIATELFISTETVKTHNRNIKSKLNIENRADLVKYAIDNLLV